MKNNTTLGNTSGECCDSVEATLAKLSNAYSDDQFDSYNALKLKDGYTESTSCNMQWGPQMRT